MLLDNATLARIARGEVRLAFRRWKRPTVRSGGTLLTGAGQLQIGQVTVVEPESITNAEAELAGFSDRSDLIAMLDSRADGRVYRVELLALGADPRIALRTTPLSSADAEVLRGRLTRYDTAAPTGAWTRRTLEVIRDRPGIRAADLCKLVDQERDIFKTNVRKLKGLGLTESLEVGYRLSPRGVAYLAALGDS